MKNNRRKVRDEKSARQTAIMREIDNSGAQNRIYRRRMTVTGNITSTGGGVMPIVSFGSGLASSAPEYSALSSRYNEYRVAAMEVWICPTRVVNISGATTTPPSHLVIGPWASNQVPATYAGIVSLGESQILDSHRVIRFGTDYAKNKDAQLWTPTAATITAAEQYGLIVGFPQTPLQDTSYVYYNYVMVLVVEFRGEA